MDRDPSANIVDNEDRSTPTTGQSPFGESGDERACSGAEREDARPDKGETKSGGLDIAGKRSEPGAARPGSTVPPPD